VYRRSPSKFVEEVVVKMGSIGIAAFGGAKGVPILGIIVFLVVVIGIAGFVGYRLGGQTEGQRPRLS